jgi:ferredoxin
MELKTVTLAYFSPTGTTKKVVESIAETIGAKDVKEIDLTSPDVMTRKFDEIKEGLVILGAPVYGGRIPAEAEERFKKLKGNGIPAVVAVVYGNREYEDALIELRDIAVEQGFKPIAGGAFIGEHSFSSDVTPLAAGRPDGQDVDIARDLGEKLAAKMRDIESPDDIKELPVPGNKPLKERHKIGGDPPATDKELCTMCMDCVEACPTGAVTVNEDVVTDAESCIRCCACVKVCPTGARSIDSPQIERIRNWLSETCKDRKEPEVFLG